MKLIIDIPEKVVTAIQNGEDYRFDIHTAIAQGISYEEGPKGDLISRQDAIGALEEHLDYLRMLDKNENPSAEGKWYGVNWARNTIADLPPENARPEGEWVHNGINAEGMDIYRCSICNRLIVTWSARVHEYPYCHCGAKMGV